MGPVSTGTAPSSTVLKAFRVLDLFAGQSGLGPADCARMLGIPRASAHRLLVSLHAAGVIETQEGGRYRLGLRLFELGTEAPVRRRLVECAREPLEALVSRAGASAYLAVRDTDEVLWVERIYCRDEPGPVRIGRRGPLHATSVGKVLLAHAPEDDLARLVDAGLARYTPYTITTEEALSAELASVRRHGTACNQQELRLGNCSVAAPICDVDGSVLAAVALRPPKLVPITTLRTLGADLAETVKTISAALGATTPAPSRRVEVGSE